MTNPQSQKKSIYAGIVPGISLQDLLFFSQPDKTQTREQNGIFAIALYARACWKNQNIKDSKIIPAAWGISKKKLA